MKFFPTYRLTQLLPLVKQNNLQLNFHSLQVLGFCKHLLFCQTASCRCSGIGLPFSFSGLCSAFRCIFDSATFVVVLFLRCPGIVDSSPSNLLISSYRMFLVGSLKFCNQSIPSRGVISFLSVISLCIFSLLFLYSMPTVTFYGFITSFFFLY